MGAIKKALKAINPAAKAEEEARKAAEEAERQRLIQAQNDAALNQGEAQEATTEIADTVDTEGKRKKKLAEGRKSLTVARSGGSGINI